MIRLVLDVARFIITFVFAAIFFIMLAVIIEDVKAGDLESNHPHNVIINDAPEPESLLLLGVGLLGLGLHFRHKKWK